MAPRKKTKARAPDGRQRALPLAAPELPTLAELVGWYESTLLVRLRESSQRTLRSSCRLAVAALPPRPTGSDVAAWLTGRVERGEWSRVTANQARKALYRVHKAARDLRWPMLLNVVAEVPAFAVEAQAPRVLPDAQTTMARLLLVCRDDTERALLHVLRDLGLRIGEALGLEPRHLELSDPERATVRIEQQRNADLSRESPLKTAAACAVMPLSPELARLLRRVLRSRLSGERSPRGEARRRFLFPYFKAELRALLERLRAAAPGAFPEGLGWHAFRHTLATELVERGADIDDVQLVLRHAQIAHTAAYVGTIRARTVPADTLRGLWASRGEQGGSTLKLSGETGTRVKRSNSK